MSEINPIEIEQETSETVEAIEAIEAYRQYVVSGLVDFVYIFAVMLGVTYLLTLFLPHWLLIVIGIALASYFYYGVKTNPANN